VVGETIQELEIRRKTGASVVGIIQEGRVTPNPDAGHRFMPGDFVAVLGNKDQIEGFREMVFSGGGEEGTEGQRHRGTKGQRDKGTEGQRDRGTEGQRDKGLNGKEKR
jgi:hypothetical protein